MDVEAQDSGVLARILVPDGTQKVSVGRPIAILAELGDDISSLELPGQEDMESSPLKHSIPEVGSQPRLTEPTVQQDNGGRQSLQIGRAHV